MALHLDGGPSSGYSWNSLALLTYVRSESARATGHLSRSPEPSSALKFAIRRGSSSPADTCSPGLTDTALPATHRWWEVPGSTAGGGRGSRKLGGGSRPSPLKKPRRHDFPECERGEGERASWMVAVKFGFESLFQPVWDAWSWTSHS